MIIMMYTLREIVKYFLKYNLCNCWTELLNFLTELSYSLFFVKFQFQFRFWHNLHENLCQNGGLNSNRIWRAIDRKNLNQREPGSNKVKCWHNWRVKWKLTCQEQRQSWRNWHQFTYNIRCWRVNCRPLPKTLE